MPIRYCERNRRYRNRQTGGLPHDVGILLLETNLQVTHARAVARLRRLSRARGDPTDGSDCGGVDGPIEAGAQTF
jgi:hypothetical protein